MGRCVFSQWGRWGKTSVLNLSNRFLKTLTEGAVTTEAGSLFQYFTTPPKMPTLSFGGGSHLRVPCSGALLGRVEREGGKTSPSHNVLKAREYLAGGNEVIPKSSLQSRIVGEVTHPSYQSCS